MLIFKLIITAFGIGFVSALPVGPSALEIVRRGVCYGFWAAFLVALGAVTTDVIYSSLALFGVSRLVINSHVAQDISGSIAAVVIAAIGAYTIYKAIKDQDLPVEKSQKKELPSYLAGLAISIFNPFVLIYWTGLVSLVYQSSYVGGNQQKAEIFMVALILGIITWTIILSYLSSLGKIKLSQKFRRNINLAIGIILVLAGLIIAGRLILM
jgi:threonine/homoserine/homoserine lactone efflux protein